MNRSAATSFVHRATPSLNEWMCSRFFRGCRRGGDGASWLSRNTILGQAGGCPSQGRRRGVVLMGGASSRMPQFSAAKRRRRAVWWRQGGVIASRFGLGTSRRLSLPGLVIPPALRRSAWWGLRRRGIGPRGLWRVCISTVCSSKARARDF